MKSLLTALLITATLHGQAQTTTPAIWINDSTGKLIISSDQHGLIVGDSLKAIVKLVDLVRLNYQRYEMILNKYDSLKRMKKRK